MNTRPELGSVARAVALWAYDPDRPREARRVIAEMGREDVAAAVDLAIWENPLLLSPKKRERQLSSPSRAPDARLTTLARKRIPELYPEIERLERAAGLSLLEREHPAVRKILRGCYPGSGGGRPRVPERYPLMLADVKAGLLDLASAFRESSQHESEHLRDEASDCYELCSEVWATCQEVRRRGRELCGSLRTSAEGKPAHRLAGYQVERLEALLDEGSLPFANSEILPVGPYGMEPKWSLDGAVREFADENQSAYEEIDRYGRIAMEWARRLALHARDLLPPHVPEADAHDDP